MQGRAARTTGRATPSAMQQAVQEDFGHDDQHPGIGIFAAVAGHQPHVLRVEAPLHGRTLHFAELLLGQGDQRRGIVRHRARMQGLEQGRLGDQRLTGAGRCADQHALLGRKPRQKRLLLNAIGLVRELVEVSAGKLVAGGKRRGRHGIHCLVCILQLGSARRNLLIPSRGDPCAGKVQVLKPFQFHEMLQADIRDFGSGKARSLKFGNPLRNSSQRR